MKGLVLRGCLKLIRLHDNTLFFLAYLPLFATIKPFFCLLAAGKQLKSASVFGRRALMRPKATDCSAPSVFIGISRTAPGSHHEPEQMLRGPMNPGEKLLLFRSASLG